MLMKLKFYPQWIYRLAINNHIEYSSRTKVKPKESPADAELITLFSFLHSKEGYTFWNSVLTSNDTTDMIRNPEISEVFFSQSSALLGPTPWEVFDFDVTPVYAENYNEETAQESIHLGKKLAIMMKERGKSVYLEDFCLAYINELEEDNRVKSVELLIK